MTLTGEGQRDASSCGFVQIAAGDVDIVGDILGVRVGWGS